MPVSKNRKGHAKKAAYHKQMLREQNNKKKRMYDQFMKEIDKYNASMTEMLNKEDRDKLPGGPDQTLGVSPIEATYTVVDTPERDPNEPIVINEPFHIVDTPEEEVAQKQIQESIVTTLAFGYQVPADEAKVYNPYKEFDLKLKNDLGIQESAVMTSYSGPITKQELDDFVNHIDPAIQPNSYCK
jgi:hypothetical protein